ncbi:MAG: anhydro-N-acetylmuramic acid kinase [Pseudomonadota bacterium]|jgi:anhydro-N-acetylmuramic acid kinase|nr:MAG: anhydro-N-acetylmuramic acid kinase [Pseudomonadota bacterium]
MTLCAGLISGTSMDGVEAVLLDAGDSLRVRDALHLDYPPGLAARLKRAVAAPAACGLDELGYLDAAIGEVFADAAAALLRKAGVDAREVRIIGSHGQTLLHRPRQAPAFTLQVGDPNRIAERTGIDVVADFRRRDMAAGGEGAPLVPAFHAAAFASPGEDRAVVNIGGIANITTLAADGAVGGFDTGPGNCLMDLWAEEHLGAPFDRDGALAARGCVDEELLATLLAEPYLALPPPKSTGRELFNRAWLAPALARHPAEVADVMATLSEFTARTIADALRAVPGFSPRELLVCGGGARNAELVRRLAAQLPGVQVASTAARGIAPEHVEAALFAWLALRFIEGQAGNVTTVTGARGPRVLGALYRGPAP